MTGWPETVFDTLKYTCRYNWESFASLYLHGTHLLPEAEAHGMNLPFQLQGSRLNNNFSRLNPLICLGPFCPNELYLAGLAGSVHLMYTFPG